MRPAIQLKNQRLIQLFRCSNGSVKPGKLKRPVALNLLMLRLLVRCGLDSELTRSGEFTASFLPFAPVAGNRVIRALDPQSHFCALQVHFVRFALVV